MGDSSGMVLRRSSCGGELSIVRRIREMQHAFNVPFQFAKLPGREDWERLNASVRRLRRSLSWQGPSFFKFDRSPAQAPLVERPASSLRASLQGLGRLVDIARREAEKGDVSSVGDPPSKIETANVSVKEGDLIILATDGLFDNVFDFEIVALAGECLLGEEAALVAGGGGNQSIGMHADREASEAFQALCALAVKRRAGGLSDGGAQVCGARFSRDAPGRRCAFVGPGCLLEVSRPKLADPLLKRGKALQRASRSQSGKRRVGHSRNGGFLFGTFVWRKGRRYHRRSGLGLQTRRLRLFGSEHSRASPPRQPPFFLASTRPWLEGLAGFSFPSDISRGFFQNATQPKFQDLESEAGLRPSLPSPQARRGFTRSVSYRREKRSSS